MRDAFISIFNPALDLSRLPGFTHHRKEKRDLSQIFQNKIGHVMAYKNGRPLYLQRVEQLPRNTTAGMNPQIKAILATINGEKEYRVRIKSAPINEAVINHRILAQKDPLSSCLPKFYGAYDSKGNAINAKTLNHCSLPSQKVYIILSDVATQKNAKVHDFKFCKTQALLRNPQEIKKHNQTKHSKTANLLMYYIFKIFSQFSFALSANTNGVCGKMRRLYSFSQTKSVLRSHLEKLNKKELASAVADLICMKIALQESNFAFSDASLLFISTPVKHIQPLKIHLIDMSHGMEKREGIANFKQVKKDAISAMDDLILFAKKISRSKNA